MSAFYGVVTCVSRLTQRLVSYWWFNMEFRHGRPCDREMETENKSPIEAIFIFTLAILSH